MGLDVRTLDELGFFRHVPSADRARVIRHALDAGFAFVEGTRRSYTADAENLAEHGVLDFLGRVAPFLRREGVPIEVTYRPVRYPATKVRPAGVGPARLTADGWFDEDGPGSFVERMLVALRPGDAPCEVTEDDLEAGDTYFLMLGDRKHVLYDAESDGDDRTSDWHLTTTRTLALLDELLRAHGSAERAYGLYGDNDLQVAFVTPAMADVINAASSPGGRLHDATWSSAPNG